MDTIRIRHLFEFVASDVKDWEGVARDIASRFAERNMAAAKGFAATAATILTTTIIPWSGSSKTQQDLAMVDYYLEVFAGQQEGAKR